jgi:hypothetical protein
MADMSKRVLVMLVVLAVLVTAGTWVYVYSTPQPRSLVEDCDELPKPKDEFAMAAECDAPGQPAGAAATGSGGQ